MSTNDVLLTEV